MSASLPYLVSPGSIKTALERIRSAATPERVSGDFVSTILQIKGGTGYALIPYLKKIGFVGSDGTPTELYTQFRNPSCGGFAVANGVKRGYKELAEINEYFYQLKEDELLSLIVQVTGLEQKNKIVKLIFSTLKAIMSFADFNSQLENEGSQLIERQTEVLTSSPQIPTLSDKHRLNLSYTINLNLPATPDQAVFNAIFRSLKDNLIS